MITKFNKIKQTIDYKKYELKEKRDIKWVNLDKNKTLTVIQKRYKATITDEQSAFKNYTNSYTISNIRVQGIKALQYLKHQDFKLKEYLQKHKGLKVILDTFNNFKSKKTNEEVRHAIRSRRYEITCAEEIPNVLSQMATNIELQMDKMELSESGLVIKQIEKIKFNSDKYNPTRGGKFIPLPKLRAPLPAKHLEEQTDTKTYDLWCRKGGGTGWQDIKATDLWCRNGGGTGWQDIKGTYLWCRKGGGTGWQDIKGTYLWCRKGG